MEGHIWLNKKLTLIGGKDVFIDIPWKDIFFNTKLTLIKVKGGSGVAKIDFLRFIYHSIDILFGKKEGCIYIHMSWRFIFG